MHFLHNLVFVTKGLCYTMDHLHVKGRHIKSVQSYFGKIVLNFIDI